MAANQALQVLFKHESMRNFTGRAFTQEERENIKRAVLQTSSSCFMQMVSVIIISDKDKLKALAEYSGHQGHIAACAEFWMFCADVRKLTRFTDLKFPTAFKTLYSCITDASLACQNALIAAEAQGLGGVVIGGYKNGLQQVSDMLKLPKGTAPLIGLCLGVPDESYREEQKPRLPASWIFMDNEYRDPFNAEELEAYDAKVKHYYENRKFGKNSITWTESCRAYLGAVAAPSDLAAYFKQQGFEFN